MTDEADPQDPAIDIVIFDALTNPSDCVVRTLHLSSYGVEKDRSCAFIFVVEAITSKHIPSQCTDMHVLAESKEAHMFAKRVLVLAAVIVSNLSLSRALNCEFNGYDDNGNYVSYVSTTCFLVRLIQ